MVRSIQTLSSVLSKSILLLSLTLIWGCSAVLPCRCWTLLHSPLPISPEILSLVRTLAEPAMNGGWAALDYFSGILCLGQCVVGTFSSLWKRFSLRFLYTSLHLAAERHPQIMMLPPPGHCALWNFELLLWLFAIILPLSSSGISFDLICSDGSCKVSAQTDVWLSWARPISLIKHSWTPVSEEVSQGGSEEMDDMWHHNFLFSFVNLQKKRFFFPVKIGNSGWIIEK